MKDINMADIWNNPLMWSPKNAPLDNNPSLEDTQTSGFDFNEFEFDIDALDAIIAQAEQTDTLSSDFTPLTESFKNIQIGTPSEKQNTLSDFKLNSSFEGIQTGHMAFGGSIFSKNSVSGFDLFNAVGIVSETGGVAERLGVSDGLAIEAGMKAGMNVRSAVDNRDTLKTAMSLLTLAGENKGIDSKTLNYMREYAVTGNLDGLRALAEQKNMTFPDNVGTTDLYHLMLASKADESNFDVIFSNLAKTL